MRSNSHVRGFFHSSLPQLPTMSTSPLKGGRKASVVWGNDSFSQLKTNFTRLSSDSDEQHQQHQGTQSLLRDIQDAVDEQTTRKVFMDHLFISNMRLAQARWSGGSRIGAILSMRKAQKNVSTKAYIAAALLQLGALRDQVKAAVTATRQKSELSHAVDTPMEHRDSLNRILAELSVASCPMPSDEELLDKLRTKMAETSSPSSTLLEI